MNKTKLQAILAKLVTTSFIFTVIPSAVSAEVISFDKDIVKLQVAMPTVSPTPHNIEGSGEGFIITDKVNIVGKNEADKDALKELVNALKELGIEVNNDFNENSATIIIGEDDDNIDEMDKFFESIGKDGADSIQSKEGYIIASNKDEHGKTTIAIEGTDEVGTYYGVKTLKQLMIENDSENIIPEVYIKDYPTQHVRAIVEGFYGNPWSQQDRLEQFKFYGENKLNMYIYAPKDDPYHRDKWREPYPKEEMDRMQTLINTSAENKVDFVFAISPGKDIDINSEDDYKALIDKCESLYNMGVRSFAILWDDIFTDDGAGQAKIMNRFNAEFIKSKEGVKPLLTVPTQYWGASMYNNGELKPYTKGFAENLDKDIEVMWTGEWVMSESVTPAEAQKIKEVYGREMLLWWNYPVNDYKVNKLALGPIYNLGNDLGANIGGFVMNPMEFAEASKITVHTGADYSWNTEDYDYNKAWDNAIRDIVGEELKDSFKVFADHSTRLDTGRKDAPEMRKNMDLFWEKVDKKQIPVSELTLLKDNFEKVKLAVSDTQSKLHKAMLDEVKPQLEKLYNYADASVTAADMVIAMLKGDNHLWWDLKTQLSGKIDILNQSNAVISDAVLDDFVKQSNLKTDIMYFEGVLKDKVKTYSYSATVSENLNPLKFVEWYNNKSPYEVNNMFDGKLDTAYRSTNSIKAGDEITVDLGQVENLNNIYMLMGRTSHDTDIMRGNLQISVDGSEWKTVLENNSFREVFVGDLNENARYIKYIATEDQENQVYIREFMVNKDTVSGIKTNVDGEFKYDKKIENRNEINSVISEGKVELKAEDTISIELPEYKFITNVNVSSNVKGNVEYTINGMDWFTLGEINGESMIQLKKPEVVKEVRFKSTEEKSIDKFKMDLVIEGKGEESVTTNRKGSGNYKDLSAVVDGDLDYSFISSGALKKGDYFTLDLGEVTNVRNIQFISDRNFGGDRIRDGKLEYSLDGQSWTEIYDGQVSEQFRMFDVDLNARYLRMTATKGTDSWLRMSDFSVNSPEAEVKFQSTVKPSDDSHRLNNLMDENIQTSYIPKQELKNGDKVVYNIFKGELINKVEVFQNESTISNAKVIARTSDDLQIELGILDKGYNVFNIEKPEEIVSITLEFKDDSGIPEIYEIVTENFTLESIKEISKNTLKEGRELLLNTDGKSEEVINQLKLSVDKMEEALIDGESKENLFRINKKLENSIKIYNDYVEESLPEEESGPNNENGSGTDSNNGSGNIDSGTQSKPNKPSTPAETGDASGVAQVLLGITSLATAAFTLKRKRK